MVNNNSYYSGASWEYVKPDGSSRIDFFTSLAHPWGAAPTYVLPEYLLGIRATAAGYKEFVMQPAVWSLDLRYVRGRVPTPSGTASTSWIVGENEVVIDIEVPNGLNESFMAPNGFLISGTDDSVKVSELLPGNNQIVLCSTSTRSSRGWGSS